jgi:dephospho-CoA kinase
MAESEQIVSRNKVVAIVGMAGSGKSEVARVFEGDGYVRIRFGDITDEELKKRGLPRNEENERTVREDLRIEYGMAAYAELNKPKIDQTLESSNVVIDGLYSWAEYVELKMKYKEKFFVLAVYSSPATRYSRLLNRQERSLTHEEAAERDTTEIENSDKGGPIAMADFTIVNETSVEDLKRQAAIILAKLK